MKRLVFCFFIGSLLLFHGCSSASSVEATRSRPAVESDVRQFATLSEDAVRVTLRTSEGDITAVLYPDLAPMACENFLGLSAAGYYNNTLFHRVQEDFIIQGGDADGTGLGGDSIWQHPFFTELTPSLHHYSGALCMAAADGTQNTLLSQFYIVASPAANLDEDALAALTAAGYSEAVVNTYRQAGGLPYLDNQDTVFGHVISGMDVVDSIASANTNDEGVPKNDIILHEVRIEYPA